MSQCRELERQIADTEDELDRIPPPRYVIVGEEMRLEERHNDRERKRLKDRLEDLKQRLARARMRGGC
jgi:hypothetical protein